MDRLSILEEVVELPHDQYVNTFKSATEQPAKRYTFSVSAEDYLAFQSLAKSVGVTCYSVISALFSILISDYTYQDKVSIITATMGRGHPFTYKMVGFFVNLLVQPFNLEKNKPFKEYLSDSHQEWLRGQDFQDIPFEKIRKF